MFKRELREHLQHFKGYKVLSYRYVKGIPFANRKVYERGIFSVKKGIKKGMGLDLGAEPSRIIHCERFEPRSHFKRRLSLIVRVNVVLNRTVVVDSD